MVPASRAVLLLDEVLEGLGDGELHHRLGGDLDRLPGGGVATDAGLPLHDLELPEAGQGNLSLTLHLLLDQTGEAFEKHLGLLLVALGLLRDGVDELGAGHRGPPFLRFASALSGRGGPASRAPCITSAGGDQGRPGAAVRGGRGYFQSTGRRTWRPSRSRYRT